MTTLSNSQDFCINATTMLWGRCVDVKSMPSRWENWTKSIIYWHHKLIYSQYCMIVRIAFGDICFWGAWPQNIGGAQAPPSPPCPPPLVSFQNTGQMNRSSFNQFLIHTHPLEMSVAKSLLKDPSTTFVTAKS